MKHFSRQYRNLGIALLLGAGVVAAPPGAGAQSTQIIELMQGTNPLLLHSSSQGYLGVLVGDVDADSAQKLKLKEVRGALITLIDHDAPAAQAGLHVNDVVLKINGQAVEGAEQFSRMLREIPPGRNISLLISRDGNEQTMAAQLVDRKAMEHDVWNKIGTGGDVFTPLPGSGLFPGGGDASLPGMFHMPIFGSTLNVGAMVEPLTGQMAEYLGVPSGLMVKQVAHKSEAATAGLKAFDVILKVGPDAITTLADWDRAIRSNQGKPVQVTILRDRRQQTLTLQVDSKRKSSDLEFEEIFPSGDCLLTAELDTGAAQELSQKAEDAAKILSDQAQDLAQSLKDQIRGTVGSQVESGIAAEQADEFRKQAEALRDQLKMEDFHIDQKQMDELKQQMEQFRKNFKPEDFKIGQKQLDELKKQMEQFKLEDFHIDEKQLDELKQQMDQFKKNSKPEDFKFDRKQLDELKKQLEEMKLQGFGVSA